MNKRDLPALTLVGQVLDPLAVSLLDNRLYILNSLGKYLLSSGRDSLVKLWELSTARCLIAYTGAGATGRKVS